MTSTHEPPPPPPASQLLVGTTLVLLIILASVLLYLDLRQRPPGKSRIDWPAPASKP